MNILSVLLITLVSYNSINYISDKIEVKNIKNSVIYSFKEDDFIIIKSNNLSLYFDKNGTNSLNFQKKYNCDFVLNGTYFAQNKDGTFIPAGLFLSGSQIISEHYDDINLNYTLKMKQNSNNLAIYDNSIGIKGEDGFIVTNIGPILYQSGTINFSIKNNISHYMGLYSRTIIIKDKGEIYFALFKNPIKLYDATYNILKTSLFDNKAEIINLDGGPSTSYYSKLDDNFIFNENKKLPLFFCLK